MTKIVAVVNQKGGVGKTTTTVNLAACLADSAQRVLMVDLDPQGNATGGCGIKKSTLTLGMKDVLVGGKRVEDVMQSSAWGVDLLPTHGDLTAAEVQLLSAEQPEYRLRTSLSSSRSKYDFILIDCPPSLTMLTLNALVAADSILIPVQCEYYALEGLTSLLKNVTQITQTLNTSLKIEGVLRTMYDPRNRLTREVSQQLTSHFGQQLLKSVIPRNVRLAEAPSFGLPITRYDRSSQGAMAYQALSAEILARQHAYSRVQEETV